VRFDDRFLEELKSRVRPSDLIGRHVKLKRAGREWVGLSPFGKEKTPSFYVNDEKGFFHDFSSGKHGDVIGFLQETQRMTFREAVETLAAEAGMELPAEDPRAAQAERKRAGLQDWLETAADWFEKQLTRPAARDARAYLERRGLPQAEWARFRLGYAPGERHALRDALVQRGAKPAELVEAGLLIQPEGGGAPYDRFRDRVVFPITDGRGRVVSFGGRALNPDERAKYLNGPDTPLFHKGRVLYGLPEARKLLATGGADAALVVVEGYMDAIACQRAGVAAVAPLGTALTEEQMDLLWRSHPEPTLCFDADGAGQRAADKSIDRALPLLKPERSFRFAIAEGGKDPDDVLREQGPAALRAQLAKTVPFVDRLFEREKAAAGDLATPEQRAGLKARLRKAAATIADPDLAQAYKEALLARFEALFPLAAPAWTASQAGRALQSRRTYGRRVPAPLAGASGEGKAAARRLAAAPRPLAAAVALSLVERPDMAEERIESLDSQGLFDPRLDALAREIVALSFRLDRLDPETVKRVLRDKGYGDLLEALPREAAKAHAAFMTPSDEARALWLQAYDNLVRATALERAIEDAKRDLERDPDWTTLLQLKIERDRLLREMKGEARH
jgi:DNA primase